MNSKLVKDLKDVDKELKSLSKKVELLVAALGKEKAPAPSRRPARKKAVAKKKAPARKPVMRAPAKKAKQASASDTILSLIRRSKKGLDNAALIEKTGYDKIKVRNVIFRLKKLGKIQTASRGIYIKA